MAYLFNDDKSKKYIDNDNGEWVKLADVNVESSFSIEGVICYKKIGGKITLKFNLTLRGDFPINTSIDLLNLNDMPDEIKLKYNEQLNLSEVQTSPRFTILPDLTDICAFSFSFDNKLKLTILNEIKNDDSHFPIITARRLVTEWTYSLND